METLGQIIDRMSIQCIKKNYRTSAPDPDPVVIRDLDRQIGELARKGYSVIAEAVSSGKYITMNQHKVGYHKKYQEVIDNRYEKLSEAIAGLVSANVRMFQVQNQIMNFESVEEDKRVEVVDNCSRFNLERNNAMDEIDRLFLELITTGVSNESDKENSSDI